MLVRCTRPALGLAVLLLCALDGAAQDLGPWLQRLSSHKYETRESAKRALVGMGLDSLPIVARILRSGNHAACRNTRDVLDRLGPATIPFLMQNLRGASDDARFYSITVLGNLAPESAPAVPLLIQALRSADDEIVYEAAWALAALREHAAPAVAGLAALLAHRDRVVRTTAAGALSAIGPAARESIPALLSALEDADATTRRAAAEALASIGLSGARAVSALTAALGDANIYVRMSAARALGTIGPAATPSLSALRKALQDPALVPDVAWAIGRISGTRVLRPAAKTVAASPRRPTRPTAGWRMLGGSPSRNAFAPDVGLPRDWGVDPDRHVAWAVELGGSYGSPIVGGGRVFIGAGNGHPYRRELEGKCGTLLAFSARDGRFLWQDHAPNLRRQGDLLLPTTTSSPLLEGDRLYYVTAQCQLRCLDAAGFHDKQNDGPFTGETDTGPGAADRIWELDLAATLGVFPHEAANCSVISAGDVLLVCTSNGVDEAHTRLPSPRAPSFIGVDKTSGAVLWTCEGPGRDVLHGQWSSPALGKVGDRELAFFGGGDGWLYALEPQTGRVVWRFDGNRKSAVWRTGSDSSGVVRRNSIIACPVFAGGRVYLGLGQDPTHGRGRAALHAIDPRGTGDVSTSRRIWSYREIGRTICTPVVRNGLVFAADLDGHVHCIDADSGRRVWVHDTKAPIWGSLLMLGDALLVGNEDGTLVTLRAGRTKQVVREIELPSSLWAAPVVHDKTLYIATADVLYAIRKR